MTAKQRHTQATATATTTPTTVTPTTAKIASAPIAATSRVLALLAVLVLAVAALAATGCDREAVRSSLEQTQAESQRDDGLQEAEVVRVVDGDTLIVNIDGERERLRLIGINCPESVAQEVERNTEEGIEASNYTKSIVGRGDTVWLESDTNDRDQYDRLLRYVWLERPTDVNDPDEIADKMLNAIIVRDGYAQAHRYGEDDLHIDVLRELGKDAIAEDRGVTYMWS